MKAASCKPALAPIEFFGDVACLDGLPQYSPGRESVEKKIELLDIVALTRDIPEYNLRRGEVGTVVEILSKLEMLREMEHKTKELLCPSSEWQDIRGHHLIQNGDCYVPDLSFTEPDPNVGCPLTQICLDALVTYLAWNKSDPHGVMTPVIAKLRELNASLDEAHESWLGEECQ